MATDFVESTTTGRSPAVFWKGEYSTTERTVDSKNFKGDKEPPRSLVIVAPTDKGCYPVILFIHGWELHNTYYSTLLQHIASHGFILVAPQVFHGLFDDIDEQREVDYVGDVADWIHQHQLEPNLPESVLPKLSQFALAGHSRGGKTAFAVALGLSKTTQKFSALIGIDPVAGTSFSGELRPKILTHKDRSFNLSIPIAVIGMALSSEPVLPLMPSCAPEGLSHVEFFRESKPPCTHLVAKDYGHLDMLDDDLPCWEKLLSLFMAKSGKGDKGPLRRCVGGIIVAFLNGYFKDLSDDLLEIVNDKNVAPVTLEPVQYIPA